MRLPLVARRELALRITGPSMRMITSQPEEESGTPLECRDEQQTGAPWSQDESCFAHPAWEGEDEVFHCQSIDDTSLGSFTDITALPLPKRQSAP